MPFYKIVLAFIRGLIVSRAKLSLELVALRHQLVVLRRTVNVPAFTMTICFGFWKDWRQALILVQPETVIKWHRQGFRMYWL